MRKDWVHIVNDIIGGTALSFFGYRWLPRIRFRSRFDGMLTSKSSDNQIGICWFAVLVVGAYFNAILSFVANVIDDSFELTRIHRTFQSIVDVDPIAKNLSMFVQRIRNPVKKETLRVPFGDMGTKRRIERCKCWESRLRGIRRWSSLDESIVKWNWSMQSQKKRSFTYCLRFLSFDTQF